MHDIRPYQLFTLLDSAPTTIAHVPIPSRPAKGGVTLLESFLIIAASRLVSARRLFEFGTFMGGTTLNLALNTPGDAQIFTIDLDPSSVNSLRQHAADVPHTEMHLASKSKLDFMGNPAQEKITMLSGNSIVFDFSPYQQSMDFVYIDGGHDYDTVAADTKNAFSMIRTATPSCILWHDYKNRDCNYEDLTRYLDELSCERSLFAIGDTMLCVWFNDPEESIVPRLLKAA